jgi:hypothetical protein
MLSGKSNETSYMRLPAGILGESEEASVEFWVSCPKRSAQNCDSRTPLLLSLLRFGPRIEQFDKSLLVQLSDIDGSLMLKDFKDDQNNACDQSVDVAVGFGARM